MATIDSKQMVTGKSFEYALLLQFEEKLKDKTNLEVIKNSSLEVAKKCFEAISSVEKSDCLLTASAAINLLMDVEPRLSNDIGKNDILQLEMLADARGESGDVRDVLAIRVLQKWEIGVSAKNNHRAVKHSRLSAGIDFGEKWLGIPSSKKYFDTITPIFKNLENIRKESSATKQWSYLKNYHSSVYMPILKAFIEELNCLYTKAPVQVASGLITYLVGNKDFYKVIKSKNSVEIHAYNLQGTLSLPFGTILPKYETPKISLPTKILSIKFKEESNTTVIVTMDNDWALSFRIHNASSKIEPSLKFDILLLNSPKTLYKFVHTFN